MEVVVREVMVVVVEVLVMVVVAEKMGEEVGGEG